MDGGRGGLGCDGDASGVVLFDLRATGCIEIGGFETTLCGPLSCTSGTTFFWGVGGCTSN